jgi:hypothetical protein
MVDTAGHPFMITDDAAGGTAAIELAGSFLPATSGSVIFTPTITQVGTSLYYQCTVHEQMGGSITITT